MTTPHCDAVAFRCTCNGNHKPTDIHTCNCGGSWRGEADTETFEVITLPIIGLPPSALLAGGVRRDGIRWPLHTNGTSQPQGDEQPTPKIWAMPEEPENIEAVRDDEGVIWRRIGNRWESTQWIVRDWSWLVLCSGPLTEVDCSWPHDRNQT